MNKYAKLIKSLRCDGDGIAEEDDGLGCANKKCKYRDVDGACDLTSMTKDAAAAIATLQAENAEKDKRIARMEAERDAAVADLSITQDCRTCGNKTPWCEDNPDGCKGYKWRGAQGEG